MIPLTRDFLVRDVLEVAPALIGKLLVRRLDDGGAVVARITQTEAYRGEEDSACHARAGVTDRTRVLYGLGGVAYVYLCYGIHWMLNVVTGAEGVPQAALIRGVEGAVGPGRVTKLLRVDRSLNGAELSEGGGLYLADDGWNGTYHTAKRVGIDYADEYYRDIEWRYILDDGGKK